MSLPSPIAETPLYILESSLQTQRLWYETAGKRPKQPEKERQYFEKLWKSNFENSCVNFDTKSTAGGYAAEEVEAAVLGMKKRNDSNENIAELLYVFFATYLLSSASPTYLNLYSQVQRKRSILQLSF